MCAWFWGVRRRSYSLYEGFLFWPSLVEVSSGIKRSRGFSSASADYIVSPRKIRFPETLVETTVESPSCAGLSGGCRRCGDLCDPGWRERVEP